MPKTERINEKSSVSERKDLRILFMGTPEIAATCLDSLIGAGYPITGVVTRQDKPKGRGGILTPPPVKVLAGEHGIPVCQPKNLREPEFSDFLKKTDPNLIVVVAYGRILPPEVLDYPKLGCINLHVSLLPAYRGAAPMQRAVMNGETETGVTTMRMDAGLDTGDILLYEKFPIGENDTFETVHDKSAALGGPLLIRTIDGLLGNTLQGQKQPENGVSYAEKIEKEDCLLDFSLPAKALHDQIRGLYPFPLAFTHLPDGRLLKILESRVTEGSGAPGTVIAVDGKGQGSITVACGEGALMILAVTPEGKGKMPAGDLVRGRKININERLGCH